MTDKEEKQYLEGKKSVYRWLHSQCLRELTPTKIDGVFAERLETLAMLRRVCEDHGDNEWEDDLYLSDIIEKHLLKHIL